MLGERLKVLVRILTIFDLLNTNLLTTALDAELSASVRRPSLDEPLISSSSFPRSTENLRSSDFSQTHSENQVDKLGDSLKAVTIPEGIEGGESGKPGGIFEKDGSHVALGASGIESGQQADKPKVGTLLNDPTEAEKYGKESSLFSSSESPLYKEIHPPEPELFDNGFYKSTCFQNLNPSNPDEPDEWCILINSTINHGKGCVIVSPAKYLDGFFKEGLKISDDPPDIGAAKIVPMPEKGGKGVVAARKIERGEYVHQLYPVVLFPRMDPVWNTPFGQSIFRPAIDHLPPQTRDAILRLARRDQFFTSVIAASSYETHHTVSDKKLDFAAIYLDASHYNHSCKPNVYYYVDPETQLLHMKAYETIEAGEELTISYVFQELYQQDRKEKLKEIYGFDCTCPHCQMSEELVQQSNERIWRLKDLAELSKNSNLYPSEIKQFLKFGEMERIPKFIARASLIAAQLANSKKEMQQVKEHAEKAKFMAGLEGGINWSAADVKDLETLLHEPETHSSHLSYEVKGIEGTDGKKPGFFSSPKKPVYKYDKEIPQTELEPLDKGFFKSTCFQDPDPSDSGEPREWCILINPTVNQGKGCVIVTLSKYLDGFFKEGLNLSDDPPSLGTVELVTMADKGDMVGAVATRKLETGDIVKQKYPVGLFPEDEPIWSTPFGHNIRRQAVDHLPLQTRAALSRLPGKGATEDEFISSVVSANTLLTSHKVHGTSIPFAALFTDVQFDNACRSNVLFSLDETTQLMSMKACGPIEAGEELTIPYLIPEYLRATRYRELREIYGFDCTCWHCSLSDELGEKSDDNVMRIIQLWHWSKKKNLSPAQAEEFVKISEEASL
ncbi:hypothetical protein PTTG_03945 [Puccinia triticina 1-1 BBBD Race 1]|uniref:SET domain-containing protein n=2 Tax=Puccinia triticina TaxID=208348 RepID=A0A180GJZ7_PUCT1|nr:uncharacterized protein PtA15_14A451 [Puccinia triticina]OAV92283.1 hypothetical protein PTTG_03945 [Puccinia triticina 1-1 BBBD Race 1]WAQ91567.1 hypothetical protein PtA15_14A451 [Puccinia triticina]WAR62370.1 hypothetical protein PtB15_14B465 [Puccinia triticina]